MPRKTEPSPVGGVRRSPGQDGPFSRRFGYRPEPEITIREDAPEWLRFAVVDIAREVGLSPALVRKIACRTLFAAPDQDNWSDGSIWSEMIELLSGCEWYSVYDTAEALYATLEARDSSRGEGLAAQYEDRLNQRFRDGGVGWQMQNGRLVVRGSEPFEAVTRQASEVLVEHGRSTAAREIHEALGDLSRRPKPDVSGAIQHAMAALECVMRELSGESSITLGDLLKRHGEALGIVPPLDQALNKLWGYASERGRHLREGHEPGFEEAELVVGVAAAASIYLSKQGRAGRLAPQDESGQENTGPGRARAPGASPGAGWA